MSLKEQITSDMKDAMRNHASERLSTIRMLLAAIKQKEVDERVTVTDTDIVSIVDKLIKQRKDAIAAYNQAGRTDMAEKENNEIQVLEIYLPQRMSEAEVAQAVAGIVAEIGASGPGDMGKVMGAAKQKLSGKADMSMVSAQVKKVLTGA